jgi:nucleotide-binding universal stress UspA family protein
MNKILVPVDFSDTSLNALLYAIKLFGKSNTEFTVLNTYGTASTAFHMNSMDGVLEDDAKRGMEAFIKKVKKEEPDIDMEIQIVKNSAVSAITSRGNSGKYDFIVMGTKGASGLKEVFMGSVAGGVISKTNAPVVVVPTNYIYRSLDEIVFAVSNEPLSDATTVEPLRKLVNMHSCTLNVLHVAKDEKPDLDEILDAIDDLNPSVTYGFGTGDVNERLNDSIKDEDAAMLCLIRAKKGLFSRIFNSSVTMKQTFNSSVPLLILHD